MMQATEWTVRSVLQWAAERLGRIEAQLLLAHALGLDRLALYTDHDRPLDEIERGRYRELIRRRQAGEPVAYIVGEREFYALRMAVGPGVLVPRPETEHLVDAARELLAGLGAPRVLDLGTGSGCIALALARHCPQARILASDISSDALAFARRNVLALGAAERVRLLQGDLLTMLRPTARFDLLIANPPYVAQGDPRLEPTVRDHEPAQALFAGPDGLALHRRIAAAARGHLAEGGALVVELGAGQAQAARAIYERAGFAGDRIAIRPDLARIDRVLIAKG